MRTHMYVYKGRLQTSFLDFCYFEFFVTLENYGSRTKDYDERLVSTTLSRLLTLGLDNIPLLF